MRKMRSESDTALADAPESSESDDRPEVDHSQEPTSPPVQKPRDKNSIGCRLWIGIGRQDREGNPFAPLNYQDLGALFRTAEKSMESVSFSDEDIKALEAGHIPQVTPTIHGKIQIEPGRSRMDIQSKLCEVLENHPALVNIVITSP